MLFANGIDLTAGTELEVTAIEADGMKTAPRKVRPTKIIIDWSGREMTGEDYAVFLAKGMSGAHVFIDYDGGIWQFVDLFDKVNRGGAIDEEAIWVVLQNKGVPPEDLHYRRGTFVMKLGKTEIPVLGCVLEQLEALEEVIALICQSLLIPPTIPREQSLDGRGVFSGFLPPDLIEEWPPGILFASNLSEKTVSPGPGVADLLDEIDETFHSEVDEDDTDFESDDDLDFDTEAFNKAFPDP
jgi:hypothetical protein